VYRALARAWVKLVASAANAVICVAETERRDVAALGIPASKLRTVRNAVAATGPASDAERAAARASLGLDDGTFAVAVAARLVEQKDPLTAVRAVAGLDGVLLFAGDGPLRRDVEAAAAANVRVLGTLANVRSAIAASDVVLSTSLWEGLPLSLLEAMWAGRPIVASDAPGNVEAVGDAAMLVPRGDADGFRAALERLRDPIERTRLARLARTRVEREFEFERMLAETDDVYGDVLTARLAVGESLS
jgi:glycosyltransferase involved in cell wall biosynthesis